MTLPDCGLYRTSRAIGSVPVGRLVYFHNHGSPGPGIYLPTAWRNNRAVFAARGVNLEPNSQQAESLDPLAPEGLYRVETAFPCCGKGCRTYGKGQLLQLGYDEAARPLLFVPEWTDKGLEFPAKGHVADGFQLARLTRLHVPERAPAPK